MQRILAFFICFTLFTFASLAQRFDEVTAWSGKSDVRIKEMTARGSKHYVVGEGSGEVQVHVNHTFDVGPFTQGIITHYSTEDFMEWFIGFRNEPGTTGRSTIDHVSTGDGLTTFITGTADADVDIAGAFGNYTFESKRNFLAKYGFDAQIDWVIDFPPNKVQLNGVMARGERVVIYGTLLSNTAVNFNPRGSARNVTSEGFDLFVATYNQDGTLRWFTLIPEVEDRPGPTNIWRPVATFDNDGDIVLAFTTPSVYDLDPDPFTNRFFRADTNIAGTFLAEYDGVDGQLKKYAFHPGIQDSYGYFLVQELMVDRFGNVYAAGLINGPVNLAPLGDLPFFVDEQLPRMFMTRYDTDLDFVWASFWKASVGYNGRFRAAGAYDGDDAFFLVTPFKDSLDLDPDSIGEFMAYAPSGSFALGFIGLDEGGRFVHGDVISIDSAVLYADYSPSWQVCADRFDNVWVSGIQQERVTIGMPDTQYSIKSRVNDDGEPSIDGFFTRFQNCILNEPRVTRDGDVILVEGSEFLRADWYQVDRGNRHVLKAQGTKLSIPHPGEYIFVYEAYNGCQDTLGIFEWNPTGMDAPNKESMTLYPNPSQGSITVHWTGEPTEATLHNLQGQQLSTVTLQPGNQQLNFDLPAGVYVLRVGSLTEKLILE